MRIGVIYRRLLVDFTGKCTEMSTSEPYLQKPTTETERDIVSTKFLFQLYDIRHSFLLIW